MITNSSFDAPSRPLIEGLGWKTVEELASGESKTMVFKSLNGLAPQYLCDLFTRNSSCSSYSLRDTGTDLRLPMKRSANGQRCFSYRGAKLWNSLSAESKQATSLSESRKSHGSTAVSRRKVLLFTVIFEEGLLILLRIQFEENFSS